MAKILAHSAADGHIKEYVKAGSLAVLRTRGKTPVGECTHNVIGHTGCGPEREQFALFVYLNLNARRIHQERFEVGRILGLDCSDTNRRH